MVTEVFVAVCRDRHSDLEFELFRDQREAVEKAAEWAFEYAKMADDVKVKAAPEGWLFLATYSAEGDYVYVIQKELKVPTEEEQRWAAYWGL